MGETGIDKNRSGGKNRAAARVQLSKYQLVKHYSFLIPIVLPPIIFLFKELLSNGTFTYFPWFEIIMILLGVYFVWNRYKALEYYELIVKCDNKILKKTIEASAMLLNWHVINGEKKRIIAVTAVLWQWEGILIDIVHEDDRILISSYVKPSFRSNPFSFGLNKKNRATFSELLMRANNGEDVVELAKSRISQEELDFQNESEWTLKRTLKRILMYLLVSILLVVAYVLIYDSIFNTGDFGSLLLSLPIMTFSLFYLITDIRIILRKRR